VYSQSTIGSEKYNEVKHQLVSSYNSTESESTTKNIS